jgi:hypothetical protein
MKNERLDTVAAVIRQVLRDKIDHEERWIQLHTIISNAIKKCAKGSGETVANKRIATAVQKELPEAKVYWDTNYGMRHVVIWGGTTGLEYNERFSALVAYDSKPVISVETFEESDRCHGSAARERSADLTQRLGSSWPEDVALSIIQYQDADKALKDVFHYENGHNSAYFSVRDHFSLPK